jgi:hypothetical protein
MELAALLILAMAATEQVAQHSLLAPTAPVVTAGVE